MKNSWNLALTNLYKMIFVLFPLQLWIEAVLQVLTEACNGVIK